MMVVLIACVTQKAKPEITGNEVIPLTEDQQYLYKEFKYSYFRSCLSHGYSAEDRKFLRNDSSFGHDYPLGQYGYKAVDSLALVQAEKIRADSIHFFDDIVLKDKEYLGGKRVLQICLQGYESQTLDSLALIWAKKISPSY